MKSNSVASKDVPATNCAYNKRLMIRSCFSPFLSSEQNKEQEKGGEENATNQSELILEPWESYVYAYVTYVRFATPTISNVKKLAT